MSHPASSAEASTPPPGFLDGMSLFRFAHAFETGGGVERILEDLDTGLLARHAVKIVRLHLAAAEGKAETRTLQVGRGTLVLKPVRLPKGGQERMVEEAAETASPGRAWLRRRVFGQPLLWRLLFAPYARRRGLKPRAGEIAGAGDHFQQLHRTHRFDLCLLHFFGGADADEIMTAARAAGVPVGLINHFANDRLLHLAIRRHEELAAGIGSVTGQDIPAHLRDRLVNLGDGIDLSCFDPAAARPPADLPAHPVLFLPARLLRTKGQLDLVRAARQLHDQGLPVTVAFAGREDSGAFVAELRREVTRLRLEPHVRFLGQLTAQEIRGWFQASLATVFPTYHPEGLPRVTLESQAMHTPVVAYATGGIAEGIEEGKTGFLVPTGDLHALVAAVTRLLREPGLRARMGEAGRRRVEDRFTVAAMCRRHEEFYRLLLSRPRRPR
jgi:glycosyltransferase involved in cell wall biosynthesis